MLTNTLKSLLGATRKQLDALEKNVAGLNGEADDLALAEVVVGLNKAQVALGKLRRKLPSASATAEDGKK